MRSLISIPFQTSLLVWREFQGSETEEKAGWRSGGQIEPGGLPELKRWSWNSGVAKVVVIVEHWRWVNCSVGTLQRSSESVPPVFS